MSKTPLAKAMRKLLKDYKISEKQWNDRAESLQSNDHNQARLENEADLLGLVIDDIEHILRKNGELR